VHAGLLQVRDRATLYLDQLGGVAGGTEAITAPWAVPGTNLEAALKAYLDGPTDAPFDLVCTLHLVCYAACL
jgi:hypothetical protein